MRKSTNYKTILITILLTLLVPLLFADNTRTKQNEPRKTPYKQTDIVEFTVTYDIKASEETSKIKLLVVLPKTMPRRQRILTIKYSPEPTRVFTQDEMDYAEFIVEEPPAKLQILMGVKAQLFRYDLTTAREKPKEREPNDFDPNDFVKAEELIEKDNPVIQSIANNINGKTEEQIVKNIQNFIIENMNYSYNGNDLSAVAAAEQKRGDCTEYSNLFVALCRAKNLPARVVLGFTSEFTLTPKHTWVEVYLSKHGWVPFDPTWADITNTSAKQYHYLKCVYVYVHHKLRIPEWPKGDYYWYRYLGKNPEINHSVEFKKKS